MARLLKKKPDSESATPRDRRSAAEKPREKKQRFAQIRQVFGLARIVDPRIGWKLAAIIVAVVAVAALIGGFFGHPIYGGFIGLPFGFLAATILLSRTAERAAYSQIEGRPGAGGAVLRGLRRGWAYEQEPVAVDGGRSPNLEHSAMVYRAVGRPGVVLIGEGPTGRANKLLAAERKKVTRLVPNVPVTTYRLGTGEGENVVATRDVIGRMRKLKKTLTNAEVSAVNKRLHALARASMPIPKGMDPQRMRSGGRPRM